MSEMYFMPQWNAPPNVRAACTFRRGGVSAALFATFNLAAHVGDDPLAVRENRARLRAALNLPSEPAWLNQVHGVAVLDAAQISATGTPADADGSYAREAGVVCATLTADCLPLLICDQHGREVAALHGGWRGVAGGIIEAGLQTLRAPRADLRVWLGPAIGAQAFVVGDEVRAAFAHLGRAADAAFTPASGAGNEPVHYHADIYQLARIILAREGIKHIYGGEHCTLIQRHDFFSFRREPTTGRMASLIWLA